MSKPMTKQELLSYIEKTWDAAQREAWGERFCDKNCTWLDHHPECDKAEQPVQQQEPVTVLPDGSAFAVMSYPLPKDHWLYAQRQYEGGAEEPIELGKPILTHALRDAVVAAVRYAIRGATNCGKESDFDPDALVQNAVYALCGPFTSPPASKPFVGLTDEEREQIRQRWATQNWMLYDIINAVDAKLKEKNA